MKLKADTEYRHSGIPTQNLVGKAEKASPIQHLWLPTILLPEESE
jgi:hypothetical protein